jgi:uncharacterized protein with ParB-like and HNH nuclease domain/predicted transport protein
MKANATPLLPILKNPRQFIIPIYQRTYSWTTKQCRQLWDDMVAVAQDPDRAGHFIGSIVYVERGLYGLAEVPQLLVIDGQQRLTTMTLLLAALRNAVGDGEGADISDRKITNYYLVNAEEEGDRRHKLVLTQNDRETLARIIDRGPAPGDASRRITENYRFFEEQIKKAGVPAATLYKGVQKLMIVEIVLDREHDNPQLIFESLNSTGLALSQADLIRNYILMGLELKVQTRLYSHFWYPMEQRFAGAEDAAPFDRFIRDYLTLKTGSIPNIRDVYEAFKAYASSRADDDVEALVEDVARFAEYYARMTFGQEPDELLLARFTDINALRVDVAYPLLLELYADYADHHLGQDDFAEMLLLVESYVFRRAICGIPTNSLNKTFLEFTKGVDKAKYLESFKARLLLLDSYRRFPLADEFARDLPARDVYNLTTRRHYLLRKLENHGRRELVAVEDYTIEHILPQNPELHPDWRNMLGPDWQRIQQTYLHTIGNLTLTKYNSSLSDSPFLVKRDHDGGFAHSPVRLNDGLRRLEAWTEATIQARGKELAALASTVWPEPSLTPDVLATYRPARTAADVVTYTLDDHPHLVGAMRDLFEHFRARVLALGPDVAEHVLKLYIAFKVTGSDGMVGQGGNFVDVVPQAARLRLSLNLEFNQIRDPHGIAKDVSGKGRWGNGDVEVHLSAVDQLDYVMMLVRQAYEFQSTGAIADVIADLE